MDAPIPPGPVGPRLSTDSHGMYLRPQDALALIAVVMVIAALAATIWWAVR